MSQRLSASGLLAAWETGAARRPIDRALALLWAAEDGGDDPADLPLAERDRRLLAIRAATFGQHIPARATCLQCKAELEMDMDTKALAASLPSGREDGLHLTSRDLAAAALAADPAATLRQRLAGSGLTGEAAARADRQIAEAAELAEFSVRLTCPDCGAGWTEALDLPTLLWAEVEAAALALLGEIAELATAFGWTEPEILALGPARRAAYLSWARSA